MGSMGVQIPNELSKMCKEIEKIMYTRMKRKSAVLMMLFEHPDNETDCTKYNENMKKSEKIIWQMFKYMEMIRILQVLDKDIFARV